MWLSDGKSEICDTLINGVKWVNKRVISFIITLLLALSGQNFGFKISCLGQLVLYKVYKCVRSKVQHIRALVIIFRNFLKTRKCKMRLQHKYWSLHSSSSYFFTLFKLADTNFSNRNVLIPFLVTSKADDRQEEISSIQFLDSVLLKHGWSSDFCLVFMLEDV